MPFGRFVEFASLFSGVASLNGYEIAARGYLGLRGENVGSLRLLLLIALERFPWSLFNVAAPGASWTGCGRWRSWVGPLGFAWVH